MVQIEQYVDREINDKTPHLGWTILQITEYTFQSSHHIF